MHTYIHCRPEHCNRTDRVVIIFGGTRIHKINKIDYVNLYRDLYFGKGDLMNRTMGRTYCFSEGEYVTGSY